MWREQGRGKAVDKRADIWAFGVVLFEVLTGRQLFAGETVSDVLAGVLKSEVDLGALPEEPPWRRTLPWAVGALGIVVGIGTLAVRGFRPGADPRELPILRFAIPLPADAPLFVESYPGR